MFFQLVVLCCLCVLWRLWGKKRSTVEPPVLSGRLPIIGHVHRILGDDIQLFNILKNISEEGLQKGGVITFDLGSWKLYGVTDPEDSLTVSNTCLNKSYVYDFTKPFFGNGLGTADALTWKRNRKLLNPAFNQQVLDGFITIFNTQAQILVKDFAKETGKPFDHDNLLRKNSLKTICMTSFGVNAEEYDELFMDLLPRLSCAMKLINQRMKTVWLHSDFIYKWTHAKKIQDTNVQKFNDISNSIIQKKKAGKENNGNTEKKSATLPFKLEHSSACKLLLGGKISGNAVEKYKPFIDLILDLANDAGCFTDEQIRHETASVIVAGHETTATVLTFALTLLGSHADVQEKAYEEILRIIGHHKDMIEKSDLSKLVYVEAIIQETMRLYPILPIVARSIDKDVKIKNYTIKPRTECFISLYGINRHNVWGPDADQFRPERWLDKETLPDPKYFASFGMGKRSCIGKVYAMMMTKITLAHVIRKFHISSDASKMVIIMTVGIRPDSGHYITLSPRDISSQT